ncbi:MAG: hypothetical protein DSZ05_02255 [Sulfurospirillum sp.]|nr:MAG: hypothetical protein DSZ05_02255 [Sulfurospirillum sp.]
MVSGVNREKEGDEHKADCQGQKQYTAFCRINGGNSGNHEAGSQNPLDTSGTQNLTRSTDIDRFYLNVQKEIRPENTNLIPYFFAGIGYEHVNDKSLGLDSQGFFNTGGGLKYSMNEKFRLVSEAKVIKKFKDHDMDVVAMLGVGMLFGEQEPTEPKTETAQLNPEIEPKPEDEDMASIIIDDDTPGVVAPAPVPVVQPIERATTDLNELQHTGDYYIQVAAISGKRSAESFVEKLENRDLRVVVKTAIVHGREVKRILVGPYMSRTEAQGDLRSVRRVARHAFIKKLS